MIYSYFIEKLARQTLAHVQNHNYEEVLKVLAPNVSHHFAGDHALGGTRHDRESVRRWFNRLGTVLPNLRFDVKNVWVKGPPWQTTVITGFTLREIRRPLMSGNFWLKKTPAEGRGGQRQAVRSARSRSRKASSLGNKKAASLGGLPKR